MLYYMDEVIRPLLAVSAPVGLCLLQRSDTAIASFPIGEYRYQGWPYAAYWRDSVPKEKAMYVPASSQPQLSGRPIFKSLLGGIAASILFAAAPGPTGTTVAQ